MPVAMACLTFQPFLCCDPTTHGLSHTTIVLSFVAASSFVSPPPPPPPYFITTPPTFPCSLPLLMFLNNCVVPLSKFTPFHVQGCYKLWLLLTAFWLSLAGADCTIWQLFDSVDSPLSLLLCLIFCLPPLWSTALTRPLQAGVRIRLLGFCLLFRLRGLGEEIGCLMWSSRLWFFLFFLTIHGCLIRFR